MHELWPFGDRLLSHRKGVWLLPLGIGWARVRLHHYFGFPFERKTATKIAPATTATIAPRTPALMRGSPLVGWCRRLPNASLCSSYEAADLDRQRGGRFKN